MINYIINCGIKLLYNILSITDYIDYKYIKKSRLLDGFKTTNEIKISDNIEIYTDTGFKPISYLYETKPYYVYTITTDDGFILKCADTHIVFDENMNEIYVKNLHIYDKIQTINGLSTVNSIHRSELQLSMCDITVDDLLHRYYSNGILSHNSVVTAIYCLWKMLFNVDKQGLILSKSGAAGVDLLKKIKDMFLNLPYYLKPGIYKWNQSTISFDNNSTIGTEAFGPTAGLGKTINFLILDEFAWCPNNEVELFYMNIIPTITTMPDSNVCIMSTQNGFNFYYTLWRGANETGKDWNGYAPFKTDWYEVPNYNMEKHCWEKRDEAWKQKMVGVLGGEANFYYQYGTQFSASDKCIINRVKLTDLHANEVKFLNIPELIKIYKSKYNVEFNLGITLLHPECLYFNPNYDLQDLKHGYFIILCDLAEGGGGDYTTFNIIKILEKDRFEQVGYFHANTINLEQAALEFWLLCTQLFSPEHAIYSIEWNTYGQLFYTYLMNLNENDYMMESSWRFNVALELDLNQIIRFTVKFEVDEGGVKVKKTKRIPGIRFTASNKVTACSLLKLLLENNYLHIFDYFTITEIENFEDKNGNGSYAASYGHDDIVMTLAQLPMIQQTAKYKELCEDIIENLHLQNAPMIYNSFEALNDYNIY